MEPVVECNAIGNGCKKVNELQLGSEGQMVYGDINICCCNYEFCNKPSLSGHFDQIAETVTSAITTTTITAAANASNE